jgi:hypothetical protein
MEPKKLGSINAGYIELSGKVVVTDPCYNRNVWCMVKDIAVKPGMYAAYIVKSDEQDFGVRVACIMVVHESYADLLRTEWEPLHNNVGVDSGQCGIFDDTVYPAEDDAPGSYDDESTFYGECCQLTLSDESGGVMKNRKGVVSSSGFGDGVYELLCQYHEGERVALMVDFNLENRRSVMKALVNSQKSK